MAIASSDPPVQVVDSQFSALVATDLPAISLAICHHTMCIVQFDEFVVISANATTARHQ